MAKGAYIGISSVARKIKKAYIGIDGVARKIKKMYIGDANGKARLFFSGGELAYYGTATALSYVDGDYLSGVSIGNYALFAGGLYSSTYRSNVDAYDTSLTKSTASALSLARYSMGSASNGTYAIFAGGTRGNGAALNGMDVYNASLTKGSITALQFSRYEASGTNVGNYALFAGGSGYDSSGAENYSNVVESYDTSLVRKLCGDLYQRSYRLASASNGTYAIFAGGFNQSNYSGISSVTAYDSSLTRSFPTELSVARNWLAGANVGSYTIFAGGLGAYNSATGSSYYNTVEAYNTSLTRSIPTALSSARYSSKGVGMEGYAVFIGGRNGNTAVFTAEAYDESLTRHIVSDLPTCRTDHAVARVGNYAISAGGHSYTDSWSGYATTVDVFTTD